MISRLRETSRRPLLKTFDYSIRWYHAPVIIWDEVYGGWIQITYDIREPEDTYLMIYNQIGINSQGQRLNIDLKKILEF